MKLLVAIIIMLAAPLVSAESSEFLYQADKGEHTLNANYAYRSYGIDFKDSSQVAGEDWEWNWEYHIIGLRYEWGVTENFSIGAGLDYISGNLEFSFPNFPTNGQRDWNIRGVEGIDLNFKGNHDFGFTKLYYGLVADISLETQKYEDSHYARDGSVFTGRVNTSKGRHEFTPFIAANMQGANSNYGIKLAYQINTDTTHDFDESGAESEVVHEGGNGLFLSLYYERLLMDKSTFGLALNYLTYEDLEITEATGSRAGSVGEERKDYEYSTDGFRFDFYGKVKTELMSLDFLPKISYFMSVDKDRDGASVDVNGDNGKISSTGGSYIIEFSLRKEF